MYIAEVSPAAVGEVAKVGTVRNSAKAPFHGPHVRHPVVHIENLGQLLGCSEAGNDGG